MEKARGSSLHLLKQGKDIDEDEKWFKNMTGRSEVVISSETKFYVPRHKYRHASKSISTVIGFSPFTSTDNASSLGSGQSYRFVSEGSQQTTSKQHIQPLAHSEREEAVRVD
ncbi:hypothetical protein FXO38_21145 [Capsicum annuum]|uniref:Uncharacterized protein n=1 Tax=Capsicum annuum TaxID=4072 RepID=A0A2G3AJJ0_CAPAN|nr:hypothetical protein FXO38_21145 [Capsicum annuum]KAF3680547.1 hypothetical protein FXO37_03262 [Capsicum annuum]PHT94389.1 hypothetical protein T459_02271 [Capsicum annuum]